jgi:TonB family protein
MKLIAGKTKGKFVNINALSSEELKNELLNETLQFLGTEHGNAVREVYPSIATPVRGNFSLAGISDINDAELTLLFGFGSKAEKRIKVKLNAKNAGSEGNVYKIWAQKKVTELDLDYEKNRDELTELGQQFGIVTRNSSLIVLETISDYIRYNIAPPSTEPELLAEYQRRHKGREEQKNVVGLQTRGKTEQRATSKGMNIEAEDVVGWLDNPSAVFVLDQDAGSFEGINIDRNFNDFLRDGYAEGGSSGIGDMLGGLVGGSGGSIGTKSRGSLKAPSTRDIDMGSGDGFRSKQEVMQVVNARMPGLRNIYNQHLKLKPGFSGKITLKFTIAASGDIMNITIVSSTTGYSDFDNAIKNMVATWKWKQITSGNTTPTIPFNFDDPGTATEFSELNTSSSSVKENSEPNINIPVRKPSDPKMLGDAVVAVGNIKKWWNTNFTPQKSNSKYPIPDERVLNINSSRSDFVKDNDYLNKLTGKTADDYQIYLKLKDDYANSPTFYFDMAEWFYTHNDKETALRILTSIADLELENASLYRLLGYRFKEYGEYVLEKFVCQKVIQWRPMEPQSYRDYALALADNGETQAALDSLYSLLTKSYSENIHRRSRGIEEAVVTEINHLIAKNTKLNTSKIDNRLLMNTPIDIRVVVNWNMNNTDIDLHVKDPNNEECFYRNHETKIGGRISADNTGGYGPEQFLLKNALKGKYRVYVNYYNDRQFTNAGPSTIMAEIFIKYADKTERRKVVNLQMSKAKKGDDSKVEVAEFEF